MDKKCKNRKYLLAASVAAAMLAACCGTGAQSFSVIHAFGKGTDGVDPWGGLLRDKAGNLYGTTYAGGGTSCSLGAGCGTVYEISANGTETVLYRMETKSENDGYEPVAPLIRDGEGNLYGTNSAGGRYDDGTVFKLASDGSYHILHTFKWGENGNLKDGAQPYGPLLQTGGFLYGTTGGGGPTGSGTAFRLTSDGTRYRILYTFGEFSGDGGIVLDGLTKSVGGVLFGTTLGGGNSGWGTVFKLQIHETETTLHGFSDGDDGASPIAGLILDGQGNLYGTTLSGGANNCNCGVVFKMTQRGSETVLYTFQGGSDGSRPYGGLVRDGAGNVYGTTEEGGETNSSCTLGCGVVFEVKPDGTEEVLHSFTGGRDGYLPHATLILGPNHTLTGAASSGGAYGGGTVFSVKP